MQVPVPDACVAAGDREVEPLLTDAQRALEGLAVPKDPSRQVCPAQHQPTRGQHHGELQHFQSLARGFSQCVRERDFQRCEALVELVDASKDRRKVFRRGPADDACVQLFRRSIELGDVLVPFGPVLDRAAHEADVAESAKKHDHSRDVVGMVATRDESFAHHSEIGVGLLQLESRAPITQRHGDRRAEGTKVLFGARLGVAGQAVYRFLLPFRPQALASDIGATRGHDIEAFMRKQHQDHDDREERPRHQGQAPVDPPGRTLFPRSCHGFFVMFSGPDGRMAMLRQEECSTLPSSRERQFRPRLVRKRTPSFNANARCFEPCKMMVA